MQTTTVLLIVRHNYCNHSAVDTPAFVSQETGAPLSRQGQLLCDRCPRKKSSSIQMETEKQGTQKTPPEWKHLQKGWKSPSSRPGTSEPPPPSRESSKPSLGGHLSTPLPAHRVERLRVKVLVRWDTLPGSPEIVKNIGLGTYGPLRRPRTPLF